MRLHGTTSPPRPATVDDLPEVARLARAYHAFHTAALPGRLRDPDPGDDDRGRLEAALRTILGDPEALLLVAGPTGRALDGFAEAYRRDPPSSPLVPARPFGLLQSLFVEEAARGRGLGRAFVEEVERWLADQGVDEIRTDTWEFEGGPRGFYEALGYRTARRELTRTIGRNASESGL